MAAEGLSAYEKRRWRLAGRRTGARLNGLSGFCAQKHVDEKVSNALHIAQIPYALVDDKTVKRHPENVGVEVVFNKCMPMRWKVFS